MVKTISEMMAEAHELSTKYLREPDLRSVMASSEPTDNFSKEFPNGTLSYETDPNGLDSSTPGAKLDNGKLWIEDILSQFPRALSAVTELGMFGAKKYSLGGWQSVKDGVRRYRNAAGRHRLEANKGFLIDSETSLPHRYAEVWNLLAALELELREQEPSDERP